MEVKATDGSLKRFIFYVAPPSQTELCELKPLVTPVTSSASDGINYRSSGQFDQVLRNFNSEFD